ncbi:hypothetical protein M9H77_08481 [Catharanthus roseus]|uniref:Uncharacterized protein n=1 Tax=Catharanthus roseus TaxID=4058 RepID=A0ACC0BYA7_CATRO|nr:hypothetical protein M9H77_08481 [Catharanthus roseus]
MGTGILRPYPRPWKVGSRSINFISYGSESMFHYKSLSLWAVIKSKPQILEVLLEDVSFQGDVDIDETSRIDLESVEIRGRNGMKMKMKMKKMSNMVRGSKKKRAHPDSYDPPPTASTPPLASIHSTTLTPFPQLPYSSPSPIPTPSSSAFAVGTLLMPAPSSSAAPPAQGFADACSLVTSHSKSFNKQSACAKIILETTKLHFVEAHPYFGKVSMDLRYEGPIRTAWEKRASTCYKDLMYDVRVDGFQPNWKMTAQYS